MAFMGIDDIFVPYQRQIAIWIVIIAGLFILNDLLGIVDLGFHTKIVFIKLGWFIILSIALVVSWFLRDVI